MFRNLMLAALTAAGTSGGLTLSTATAAPAAAHDRDRDRDDHDRHGRVRYQVLARHRGHWDVVDTFRDRDDAYRLARQIERRGGDATVRRVERDRW